MKKTSIFAALAASAVAASALTAAASAYSLNDKNLGKNWSLNVEVPASEFADVTADSYITITFTADPDETEYWCIKPCVNDGGWMFIADEKYLAEGEDVVAVLSEAKDTFAIESADMTSVTFKVPSGAVDILKESGMPIIGHSITLHELTISDEAPAAPAPAPSEGDDTTDDTTDDTADDTDGSDKDRPDNPDTGIEGVAAVAGAALIAAAAVAVSRKRK